MKTSYQAPGMW